MLEDIVLKVDQLIKRDLVHGSAYSDQQIFEMEMKNIFTENWVYIGHEAEVSRPGDYKTGYIGLQPIILTKDQKGELHVLFNRCSHRGAQVCQVEYGNSSSFRCAYHGWTYENTGELTGVTFSDGYDDSFNKSDYGLKPVALIGVYGGFIFASIKEDVQPIEQYLAGAKEFIDEYRAMSPIGKLGFFDGVQKTGYDGNWKYSLENGNDGYHPDFVHRSAIQRSTRENDSIAITRSLGNGHGVIDSRGFGPVALDASDEGGGWYLVIFPNLVIIKAQIRIIQPISVNRTEVHTRVVRLEGVDEKINRARLRNHQWGFGPAGFISPDDYEMFRRNTIGFQATSVDWVVLKRGMSTEKVKGKQRIGGLRDETPQRGFWRQWKLLMNGRPAK